MTDDHVIPLSLGGHDQFTIRVSERGNAEANRLLDEAVCRHPFVAFMRRTHKIVGRQDEVPNVRWPTKVGDAPGILNWSKPKVELATFRSKGRYGINMTRVLDKGEAISSEGTFDADLLTRFGCRLALGASYHLFGDVFREHGYHNELRDVMRARNSVKLLGFKRQNMVGDSPFWGIAWPESPDDIDPRWGEIAKRTQGHLVFTHHSPSRIVLGIVLFEGFFHWYFNISKDPSKFPARGAFDLGSATEIRFDPLTIHRTDLRSYLEPAFKELLAVKTK
jgi:hypothetical protein